MAKHYYAACDQDLFIYRFANREQRDRFVSDYNSEMQKGYPYFAMVRNSNEFRERKRYGLVADYEYTPEGLKRVSPMVYAHYNV